MTWMGGDPMRRRAVAAAVLMMGVLAGMARGQEAMVPDPRWTANPGEEANIYRVPCPTAGNPIAMRHYLELRKAGDSVGMKEFVDGGHIVPVAERAGVLVIARDDPRPPRRAVTYTSPSDLADSAMRAGLADRDAPPVLLRVRFKDGPLAGQARFVPEDDVARLIPAAPSVAPRARPRALPPATPEARAAGLLRAAGALEKAGRPAAALADYREILARYPGTAAAREAAGRIEALAAAPPPRP
jgi:hypothetical protein